MANPTLPEEIVVEIFSRLPTKSVGRCRTLSKSWNSNLSTNQFIKKHLIKRQQSHQQNVALTERLAERDNDKLFTAISPTKRDEVFAEQSFSTDEWYAVSGSYDGLLLLTGNEGLLLVNPITRKHVTIELLPPIKRKDLKFCYSTIHGFGYDCVSDDYKIVTLSAYSPRRTSDDFTTFIDVYYVKIGVWERHGEYPSRGLTPKRYGEEGGALVNGALHWFMARDLIISCIAAFDLSNEVFYEVPMPTGFDRELEEYDGSLDNPTKGLAVVGGCLSIVDNYNNGTADIWILKEYGVANSWVRFHIESDYQWPSIVATLCFVEDGELLCVTSYGYLFACDLKGGSVKKVTLGGCDNRFSHGMAFVDSLVCPGIYGGDGW